MLEKYTTICGSQNTLGVRLLVAIILVDLEGIEPPTPIYYPNSGAQGQNRTVFSEIPTQCNNQIYHLGVVSTDRV